MTSPIVFSFGLNKATKQAFLIIKARGHGKDCSNHLVEIHWPWETKATFKSHKRNIHHYLFIKHFLSNTEDFFLLDMMLVQYSKYVAALCSKAHCPFIQGWKEEAFTVSAFFFGWGNGWEDRMFSALWCYNFILWRLELQIKLLIEWSGKYLVAIVLLCVVQYLSRYISYLCRWFHAIKKKFGNSILSTQGNRLQPEPGY